ncbi:MAG: glyoxalase superfamily protein [Cyanobacteria bacterium P01_H01_bin.153]
MGFANTTPILRIFDEVKAKEFYVDFFRLRSGLEASFCRQYAAVYLSV